MGDPPRAVQPGKLLESVCYRTFVLWPLESGNWGSLSLKAIAPVLTGGNCHNLKLENLEFSNHFIAIYFFSSNMRACPGGIFFLPTDRRTNLSIEAPAGA